MTPNSADEYKQMRAEVVAAQQARRERLIAHPAELLTRLQQAHTGGQLGAAGILCGALGYESPGILAGAADDQPVPDGRSDPLWQTLRLWPRAPAWSSREEAGTQFEAGLSIPALDLYAEDRLLRRHYTYSAPSPCDIELIVKFLAGDPLVEIGAGAGYWAYQLAQAGVQVDAYEPYPVGCAKGNEYISANAHQWYTVTAWTADKVIERRPDAPALLICWPAHELTIPLNRWRGRKLIFVGEHEGAVCGSDEFFAMLYDDFECIGASPGHIPFMAAWHDQVALYVRP